MSDADITTWHDAETGAEIARATVRRLGPGEGPSPDKWCTIALCDPPLLRDKWYVKRWGDETVSAGPFDTHAEAHAEVERRKTRDE